MLQGASNFRDLGGYAGGPEGVAVDSRGRSSLLRLRIGDKVYEY